MVSSISTRADLTKPEPPRVAEPTQAEREARDRADRAGERRFIRERTHKSTVAQRIGEPDGKEYTGLWEIWTYEPTRLDQQTRTRIVFNESGFVFDVQRTVAR